MTEYEYAILDAVNTEIALDGLEADKEEVEPVVVRLGVVFNPESEDEEVPLMYKRFESFHDAFAYLLEYDKHIWACTNPTINPDRIEAASPERKERLVRYAKAILGGERV